MPLASRTLLEEPRAAFILEGWALLEVGEARFGGLMFILMVVMVEAAPPAGGTSVVDEMRANRRGPRGAQDFEAKGR